MLDLDTTGPDITITAPSYTIPQIETEIWVRASELLSTYQEFYIIDGLGARYDLIFEYLGDAFRGIYNFNDISLGICTIYARVKDEGDNLSPIVSTAINVRQPAPLDLTISKRVRSMTLGCGKREVRSSIQGKKVSLRVSTRQLSNRKMVREVKVVKK